MNDHSDDLGRMIAAAVQTTPDDRLDPDEVAQTLMCHLHREDQDYCYLRGLSTVEWERRLRVEIRREVEHVLHRLDYVQDRGVGVLLLRLFDIRTLRT